MEKDDKFTDEQLDRALDEVYRQARLKAERDKRKGAKRGKPGC